MIPFDYYPTTRFVFGPGRLSELGQFARELGGHRVLVVSDRGVISAGHTGRGLDVLRHAGLTTLLFDGVRENPTTDTVDAGLAVAREFAPDLIVGLGGGSSLDCAKGINFLLTNGGRMQDYWGVGKAKLPMLPSIGVPTTAGTGSEAQSFALISDANTHVKMACGDKKVAFKVALLDPELTVTMPRSVTALTGLDAIVHAVESFVTTKRTPLSAVYSREAWRWLVASFLRVLESPTDLEARGGMLMGACLAGMAIENSMLGAAHALANPLTAEYEVAHGQAVSLMLPHVVRYNAAVVESLYRDLLAEAAGVPGIPEIRYGAAGLADYLRSLTHQAGLATKLAECGVARERIPQLAEAAARQWTGTFNPRPVDATALALLYEQAY
ncbi:MAG: iron-containing alcohol dehydrogenase [Planctomycetota bacterium]